MNENTKKEILEEFAYLRSEKGSLKPFKFNGFIEKLSSALDRMEASTLKGIREKVEACLSHYPEDVFIPPSKEWLHEIHEFAKSKGHTLDAINADMARRALRNILSLLTPAKDESNKESA